MLWADEQLRLKTHFMGEGHILVCSFSRGVSFSKQVGGCPPEGVPRSGSSYTRDQRQQCEDPVIIRPVKGS